MGSSEKKTYKNLKVEIDGREIFSSFKKFGKFINIKAKLVKKKTVLEQLISY